MIQSPDIAGFKAAQTRLRDVLGTEANFKVPGPRTYPPGTQLDPQTSRPYDPAIRPLTEPVTTKTHKVGVLTRVPNARFEPEKSTWGGLRRGDTIIIQMDPAVATDVQDATEVEIKGLNFTISEVIPDPSLDDRFLGYLELR